MGDREEQIGGKEAMKGMKKPERQIEKSWQKNEDVL